MTTLSPSMTLTPMIRQYLDIKSLWGNSSDKIVEGSINGNNIFFLSRHGLGHKLSPSSINYEANIDCLKKCGVTDIISLSAVGSLKKSLSFLVMSVNSLGSISLFWGISSYLFIKLFKFYCAYINRKINNYREKIPKTKCQQKGY